MRELWAHDRVDHTGEFVSFSGMSSNPKPVRGHVPIVVGGHSRPAAERAGRYGDGFVPLGGNIPELIDIVRQVAAAHGRDPLAIEITASHDQLKRGHPAEAIEQLASWAVDRALLPAYHLARGEVGEACRHWADLLGITLHTDLDGVTPV